jgi:hypothetical protein
MEETEVRVFLESYGQALSTGDLAAIADAWAVPALVLADQGAVAVGASAEVEAFFKHAVAQYHAQGQASTHPTQVKIERLGERLAEVDVSWEVLDDKGVSRSVEHSHYILWQGEDGRLRIRVALTRVE